MEHAGQPSGPGRHAGRRRCGLRALTAAAFTLSGILVLAGTFTGPGTAGIFTPGNGTWQAAGPAPPAALAGQDVTAGRLTRTAQGMTALLVAGTGPGASLLAAWSAGGGHWTLSPPLPLHGGTLTVWQHAPGGAAWAKIQVINVPRGLRLRETRTRADVCPPRVVTARMWPRP